MPHPSAPVCAAALLCALSASTAQAALPANQPPLEQVTSTPNFDYQMRRGLSGTVHFMPSSKVYKAGDALDRSGTPAPGNPLGYHPGYVNRGFREPYFLSTTKDVVFWACANGVPFDCDNGFAIPEQIIMPTEVYGKASESCIRGIVGHELFHHIQFGYNLDGGGSGDNCGGGYGASACEGHARALQDKIYFDLDLDPAASCVATFRGQVNGYLDQPDVNIWQASYGSALFWTYLMEQYGSYPFEPGLGVDFLVDWWERARDEMSNPSIYGVTDDTIKQSRPDDNATNAFHDFTIANTLKARDLSQVSDAFRARYTYRDEDPVPLRDNQMAFKQAAISQAVTVPPNGSAVSLNINARRFGARYYDFITEFCPTGNTLEFRATPTAAIPLQGNAQLILPDGLFSLIALEGSTGPGKPRKLLKHRARDWKQTLVQPSTRYNRITAIVSGWHTDFAGSISMRCLAPPPLPLVAGISTARPLVSGAPGSASLAQFSVDVSEPGGGGLDTLDIDDFQIVIDPAGIGLLLPAVQKVREAAARMKVSVQTPNLPLGAYDAQLRAAGQTIDIPGGFRVGAHQPEVLVAVDTSASMGLPAGAPRLNTLKIAAQRLGHALPSNARLGLLRFAGSAATPGSNVSQITALASLSVAHRALWLADLAALNPTPQPTIKLENVLITGISAFNAQGADGERHLVIVTDSGDGSALDVAALVTQARNAGIRLHLLALGAAADQPLLARLASQTGGSYAYVDVPVAGANRSELVAALDDVVNQITRRQSVRTASASTGSASPAVLTIPIDPGVDAGNPHVKVFDGITSQAFSAVRLYRPDNSQVLAGPDVQIFQNAQSFAFHVANAPTGQWRLEVDSSAAGGAIAFDYAAAVVDPTRSLKLGFSRPGGDNENVEYFRIGEPVLIQAALTDLTGGPTPPSATAGLTKSGPGTLILNLRDDGTLGDQFAGDRIYSAIYRASDSGSPTGFLDDESAPGTPGSANVRVSLNFGTPAAPQWLEARGSFAVTRESVVADADLDGLPDRFEVRQPCLNPSVADATSDRDGDGASNAAEFAAGSDPCDVDSDDGGERDGSELAAGRFALDAGDDGIKRIRDVEILSQLPEHEVAAQLPAFTHTLRFDSDPAYATILVKRALAPAGPFTDHAVIDAVVANGRYVDPGLVNGQTYCYQLIARSAAMVTAAASDLVCATARGDSSAPRGSIILNDGDPRTSSTQLSAAIAVDHESSAGMQMRLALPDGSDSGWLTYAPLLSIDASSLIAPAVATVALTLRDAAGNESIQYVDDIDLLAAANLGAITGQVRVDTRFGDADVPLADVAVMPDSATEPGTRSSADGSFLLGNLPPGSYTLEFELPGYATRFVANVVVSGGATESVGVVRLIPQPLFRDGFEN